MMASPNITGNERNAGNERNEETLSNQNFGMSLKEAREGEVKDFEKSLFEFFILTPSDFSGIFSDNFFDGSMTGREKRDAVFAAHEIKMPDLLGYEGEENPIKSVDEDIRFKEKLIKDNSSNLENKKKLLEEKISGFESTKKDYKKLNEEFSESLNVLNKLNEEYSIKENEIKKVR